MTLTFHHNVEQIPMHGCRGEGDYACYTDSHE